MNAPGDDVPRLVADQQSGAGSEMLQLHRAHVNSEQISVVIEAEAYHPHSERDGTSPPIDFVNDDAALACLNGGGVKERWLERVESKLGFRVVVRGHLGDKTCRAPGKRWRNEGKYGRTH